MVPESRAGNPMLLSRQERVNVLSWRLHHCSMPGIRAKEGCGALIRGRRIPSHAVGGHALWKPSSVGGNGMVTVARYGARRLRSGGR